MSIAVVVGVHDGVVLAADSASTLTVTGAGVPGALPGGVVNVYDNANKIINLYKGCPLGCITFGSGSIGNASIATLLKDLRAQLGSSDWAFDRNSYTIQSVAETLARFMDKECAKVSDPALMNNTNLGFLTGGYSRPGDLGETWSIEIVKGKSKTPIELRKKEDAAISWGGQSELLHRMVLGYSPQIFSVLADATGNPQGAGTTEHLQSTLGPLFNARMQASMAFAPMPIQDAIDLARFLVQSTIQFSRFGPGPQVVGGPMEIAAITKHEGFKWISRKHYYSQELNIGD